MREKFEYLLLYMDRGIVVVFLDCEGLGRLYKLIMMEKLWDKWVKLVI